MNMFIGYLAKVDTQLMGTVTIAGISIVFCVLLLLVGIFYAFGAIMSPKSKSKDKSQSKAAEKSKPAQTVAKAPAAPVVENGITPEIVAAISAAIAYSEGGQSFTIKSIKRQKSVGRPAWAAAGIADNTRPF